MRGLTKLIEQEYGKNTLTIYRKVEKMDTKISNFKNHQRFSLRCISKGIVPVSLRLKNLFRIEKEVSIIYKVETKLLNERIRNINSTIDQYEHDGTCNKVN